MGNPTLEKHTAFGFQIQAEEGTAISDNVLWCPFNDTLDFKLQGNREVYRQADMNDYLHLIYSTGVWFAGGAPIILQPVAGTLDAMIDWLTTRDSYNQAKWASCYLYDDARGLRGVMDAKIREATIRLAKGTPVALELQIAAKKPTTEAPTPTVTDTGGPYLWRETTFDIDFGGAGSMSTIIDIEASDIRIDENLEDPAEGLRLTAAQGHFPQKLYNIGMYEATGSFSRDFLDTAVYDVWKALCGADPADANDVPLDFSTSVDAQINYLLSRGGISFNLLVNRCQYMDHSADPAGSNVGRIVEAVEWQALGSDDGNTAPITLTTP